MTFFACSIVCEEEDQYFRCHRNTYSEKKTDRISTTDGVVRRTEIGVEISQIEFLDQFHSLMVELLDMLPDLSIGGIVRGVGESST